MLLSAFPDVPVLSSAGVDPASLIVLTAVDLPGILAVATISAVAAVPILLVFPLFLASLLLPFYLLLADVPAPSCAAFGSTVAVVLSTVGVKSLL